MLAHTAIFVDRVCSKAHLARSFFSLTEPPDQYAVSLAHFNAEQAAVTRCGSRDVRPLAVAGLKLAGHAFGIGPQVTATLCAYEYAHVFAPSLSQSFWVWSKLLTAISLRLSFQ
jgi:hypothetical protein